MTEPLSRTFGPVTVYFGDKNGKYPDGNQVVVRGRDTTVAFDTPLVSQRMLPVLREADLVVLGHVHEDHAVALGDLVETPVFAPEQDVDAVRSLDGILAHYGYSEPVTAMMRGYVQDKFHFRPRPDAQGYRDGQTWDLGGVTVRALHMPGHTRGHTVLLVEPEGVAFIGDIDLSSFGPYYGDGCSNLAEFIATLDKMRELPAKVWITSHHKGAITDPEEQRALLEKFTGRIAEREQAIREALRERPRSLDELVARRFVYPAGYDEVFVDEVERKTIGEHLALLVAQGRASQDGGIYRMVSPHA